MTSLQALSLIHRWFHHDSPQSKSVDSPEKPPLQVTEQQGCSGYQTGTGAILHQQQKLLDQLNEQLNLPDELQRLFNQTLDNLVSWVHLLPAHPQHHCEPAGAIRHALETAFWSVVATEQIHFDHELYPDQRRMRQPLWRLIAGVAGLLYDSGRVVSSITVHDSGVGHWPSLQAGLEQWLQKYRITGYQPHWVQSDNRPDKPLSSEYTCINLLLLDKLTSNELGYVLKPDHDKGSLWQTFIGCLTGQSSPQSAAQMVSAIELARLKSVKLHFIGGAALAALNSPEPDILKQDTEENVDSTESAEPQNPTVQSNGLAQNCLQQVIKQLKPENTRWKKDSLVLRWPDDCQLSDQEDQSPFPTATELLNQWSEQGWLRQVGDEKTFLRSGQRYVFLQPDISLLCRQWLNTQPETESSPC